MQYFHNIARISSLFPANREAVRQRCAVNRRRSEYRDVDLLAAAVFRDVVSRHGTGNSRGNGNNPMRVGMACLARVKIPSRTKHGSDIE